MFILGFLLGMSMLANAYFAWRRFFYDGEIVIVKYPDGKKVFSLDVGVDPDDIEKMKRLNFRVNPEVEYASSTD